MSKKKKQSQKPQARWSRKQKKLGNCTRCGSKRTNYRQLCDRCQGLFTAYIRAWRQARRKDLLIDHLLHPPETAHVNEGASPASNPDLA